MKRLAFLFVLFASFCSLPAATVTGLVQNVRSVAAAGMRIQLTPTNTPVVIDGVFYHSSPVLITVAADGTFSVSNLITGTYRSRPGDLARDAVSLCVPNDSNTYNWTSIICDGSPSTLTNLPIYVRGVAQGTNIITVTNATGVVTVHGTGGGGSTDLTDLNNATNALNTRVTSLESGSGGVTTAVATNIARDFATNSAMVTSNALWLAPYALSFPTGVVLYTHPRSGFYQDSSGATAATNQGLIALWRDASGRGNHLTSTNATARPRLVHEDGRQIAFFANGDSQSASNVLEFPPGLLINSRAFSVFFVLNPMGVMTNLGIMQASNNNPGIIIEGNGDERGVVSLYGTSLVQSHIPARGSRSVLGVIGDTNMARIYHHGESTNLAAYASAVASGGIIGRWVNQRPFYGKIESVLLFDRALPAQEAQSVVSKLQDAFALPVPNRNRLIVIGDSIARGDTTSNGLSYAQQVVKRLGQEWEIINLALGGQYLSTIKNHATNTIVPLILPGRRNVVLAVAGSNDIKLGGSSAEDTYTNLVTLGGTISRAGAQMVAVDILPRQSDATFNTKRLTFNALVASTWSSFAAGYVPFASDGNIGDSGDEVNTTLYSDTIHPTEAGAAIMANWTVPVILSLPISYQPASAALTNLASNPNVATNILGAGTVTVSSNNAGGWTITGSGLATNASQFAANTVLTIKDGAALTNTSILDASLRGTASAYALRTDTAYLTNALSLGDYAKLYYNSGADELVLTNEFQNRGFYFGSAFRISSMSGSGNHVHVAADGSFSRTNISGGSGSQTPWTSDIDGAGYSLTNVSLLQINGTGFSQLLLGTQNTAGLTVEAPSTPSTNGWGVKFFASASVQEIAPGSYNDWQMTNNAGAALTLVFTNAWAGQWGSVKLPGATSGGSDYAVTVVQPLGDFVRFHFPTNGSTTFTRTNGQDCQLEYWFTRLNTTNVLNCALGRAIQ